MRVRTLSRRMANVLCQSASTKDARREISSWIGITAIGIYCAYEALQGEQSVQATGIRTVYKALYS